MSIRMALLHVLQLALIVQASYIYSEVRDVRGRSSPVPVVLRCSRAESIRWPEPYRYKIACTRFFY
jgi:hypothetical protein